MITPKQSVLTLKPYINGRNNNYLFQHSTRVMKLDSNELSFPPSPRVSAALTEFIQKSPLNWYPDIKAELLHEKISAYTGLPADFVQTFHGSDHALETLCKTYLEPGDEVLICLPTYDHFRVYVQACDAHPKIVSGSPLNLPPPEKTASSIAERTKIVYIVNSLIDHFYSQEDILTILDKAHHALVLVDEAYYEFSDVTVAELVRDHPNLVVSRSFSKAFGLAGMRCGYLLARQEILSPVNKVRLGKINSLTQVAACAALDDLEYMERSVFEVQTARRWLLNKLRGLGLFVADTRANYLFVEAARPEEVTNFLAANNIFVRTGLPYMASLLRITIGHQLLMERFWKVFEKVPRALLFAEDSRPVTNISRATIQT